MSVLGLLLFKIGFVFDCNVAASEADCSVCMYTTAIETDFYYGVCMDAAGIVQWVEPPTEKPKRNTDAGSSPRYGNFLSLSLPVNFQCRLLVFTVIVQPPFANASIATSVCTLKIPNAGSRRPTIVGTHKSTVHADRSG